MNIKNSRTYYAGLCRNDRIIFGPDITYIALTHGFVYLTAIIDWYSRMILSWRLSNTMDVNFCVECLQDAFNHFGEPEFFNSDQGVQFTSQKFLKLFDNRATKNSMDGKGRWIDNVIMERFWWTAKYEYVHLRGHETVDDLRCGLKNFIDWYNNERVHSSLGYSKPRQFYFGDEKLPNK